MAPTLAFIKVTFFILYLQLFRPIRGLRVAIWAGGIITVLFYLSYGIELFVLSTPSPGEDWLQHFTSPAQSKEANLSIPLPAVGLALNLYILVIPLIGIYNLQIPIRRKIGVAMVFLTAIVSVFLPFIETGSFTD